MVGRASCERAIKLKGSSLRQLLPPAFGLDLAQAALLERAVGRGRDARRIDRTPSAECSCLWLAIMAKAKNIIVKEHRANNFCAMNVLLTLRQDHGA